MNTAQRHFRQAEKLLDDAADAEAWRRPHEAKQLIAKAKVHAKLAEIAVAALPIDLSDES